MITSLQQVSAHLQNKAHTTGLASLFVVVVDATFPLERPANKDYITQITIIDPTIGNQHYVYKVYLIGPKSNDVMMINVGQVLFLSRFQFMMRGQYYIEGRPTTESKIQKQNDVVVTMNQGQIGKNSQKIKKMKQWFIQNYEQLYKPNIGVDQFILNEKVLVANSFNMILRIKDQTVTNLSNIKSTHAYTLSDESNNLFTVMFPAHFDNGSYVFIKNISHVENNLHIALASNSNIMKLPKVINYSYKTISSKKQQYNYLTELTSMKCSLVIQNQSITSLRQLMLIVQEYQKGNRMIRQDHPSFFTKDRQTVLQQQVIRFYPISFSGGISLFNGVFFLNQKQINREKYNLSNFSSKLNNKLWYVYNMIIWAKDASLEDSNDLFPILLFDFDGNGSNFFPDINLSQLNNKKIPELKQDQISNQNYQEDYKLNYKINQEQVKKVVQEKDKIQAKIQEWMQQLYQKTNPLNPMTMVVQPLVDKFQMRYRVSNTKLNYFL